jgi:transcriptional regulator with XRE-family HTH domain
MTEHGHGPADYKKRLGERIAELMEAAGTSKDQVEKLLECSPSKVNRILRGDVAVNAAELRLLLDHFKLKGTERDEMVQLGEEARRRRPATPWGSAVPEALKKYFPTEETALLIRTYDPEVIHGLAQTEDYARALISSNPVHRPGDVTRLVQARMARQQRLNGANPPELHMVLSEGALHREVGGPEVMKAQLQHLVELSKRPNITIQVVTFKTGAHVAAGFSFVLFTPPDRPVVAYTENLTDGLFVTEPGRTETYDALTWPALLTSANNAESSRKLLSRLSQQL